MFSDQERAMLVQIPEADLLELCTELDSVAPSDIVPIPLLEALLPSLVDTLRVRGVPLSRYDKDDIEELPGEELAALSKLLGLPAQSSVRKVLKAGQKVYKVWERDYPNSAIALLLPVLLRPVLRHTL